MVLRWIFICAVIVASVGLVLLPGETVIRQLPPSAGDRTTTAIDLLGDTWDGSWTSTVPTATGATDPALPVNLRPLVRPEFGDAVLSRVYSAQIGSAPRLRPLRRTDTVLDHTGPTPLARSSNDAPTTPVTVRPAVPLRWVVRSQGTGEVVAELPLGAALAMLRGDQALP